MNLKSTLTCLLAAATTFCACGKSHYATAHNGFASILSTDYANVQHIDKGLLTTNNETDKPIIILDSCSINSETYRYTLRFANLHNQEGKSYKVKSSTGKSTSLSYTECALIFDFADSLNYFAVSTKCTNSDPMSDMTDSRQMQIVLYQVNNGQTSVIKKVNLTKGVNLNTALNALNVRVGLDDVTVYAGHKKLSKLFTATFHRNASAALKCGYFVGPGALMAIERSAITTTSDPKDVQMTQWTIESLKAHFNESRNPIEGFWTYLDQDVDDRIMRIGGRYTIALIENKDGYDIIYVGGAKVKSDNWKQGMLKGRLQNTIFTDNYSGYWIDATHVPIAEDVFGTIENGVILNMKFPIYKSQMRFSRVLDQTLIK